MEARLRMRTMLSHTEHRTNESDDSGDEKLDLGGTGDDLLRDEYGNDTNSESNGPLSDTSELLDSEEDTEQSTDDSEANNVEDDEGSSQPFGVNVVLNPIRTLLSPSPMIFPEIIHFLFAEGRTDSLVTLSILYRPLSS